MHRHIEEDLYSQIASFDALDEAHRQVRKSAKKTRSYQAWAERLEENMLTLREKLLWNAWVPIFQPDSWVTEPWKPHPLHHFLVHEPKTREISNACIEDKIVLTATDNVIRPYLERQWVPQSFAGIAGKGPLKACKWLEHCMASAFDRGYGGTWMISGDFKKFYPYMSHLVLKDILAQNFVDKRLLRHLDTVVDDYQVLGLPIGLPTSQTFGNAMGDKVDHLVVNEMGIGLYARYTDDTRIFCSSHEEAVDVLGRMDEYARGMLGLRMHERKTKIQKLTRRDGNLFTSYRVFFDGLAPKRIIVTRAEKRIAEAPNEEKRKEYMDSLSGYVKWCDHATGRKEKEHGE